MIVPCAALSERQLAGIGREEWAPSMHYCQQVHAASSYGVP
jgi:hypothetical protein